MNLPSETWSLHAVRRALAGLRIYRTAQRSVTLLESALLPCVSLLNYDPLRDSTKGDLEMLAHPP